VSIKKYAHAGYESTLNPASSIARWILAERTCPEFSKKASPFSGVTLTSLNPSTQPVQSFSAIINLMNSQKVVIPAQAGIQGICKVLKGLDSRFHGNDGEKAFLTFYETIKAGFLKNIYF
jgi:hypothetical protein